MSGIQVRIHDGVAADETTRRFLPWLVAAGLFMESLDTTILNTAMPAVSHSLRIAPLSMKAVLASYTLSLAVFIPVSGWMANRYGTRRVFSAAIALFTLGSLLCGLSTDLHSLVVCRVLQGAGGAMMVPVGRIALVRTFAKSELVRAMSFVSIPGYVGPMLGPLVGGLIISYFQWRVIFWVNIPIGLVGLFMAYRYLPDFRAEVTPPLDVAGLVLFGSGFSLLSYGLEIFGEHALSRREIAELMAISVILIAAYGFRTMGTAHPLLRLGLLRIRSFRVAVLGNLCSRLSISGLPFLLPLLYQVGLGFTPLQSGLMMMPQALAAMTLKLTLTRILKKFGHRRVLLSNTALLGLIILSFSSIDVNTPVWLIVIQSLVFGAVMSTQYTSLNTLAYAEVNAEQSADASAIASTAQQLAVSFGVASAALAASMFIPDHHHASAPQLVRGIQVALGIFGAFAIASTAVFQGLRPGDGGSVSNYRNRRTVS